MATRATTAGEALANMVERQLPASADR